MISVRSGSAPRYPVLGTTTKEMVKNVASSYSNGEVEVIEDTAHYRFVIRFVGMLGIPGNMADLKLTIEEIKPAHLVVEYEYIYNIWRDVEVLTWEQAAAYTWEEIRSNEFMEFNRQIMALKKPGKEISIFRLMIFNENTDMVDQEHERAA